MKFGFPNPFILTDEEKAIFLQLILFADQALIPMILRLSQVPDDRLLTAQQVSVLAFVSLLDLLDLQRRFPSIGDNVIAIRELAEMTKQIAQEFRMPITIAKDDRQQFMKNIHDSQKSLNVKKRSRLAENNAIPRCEQLCDLGLVEKEDLRFPPRTDAERLEQRTQWRYRPNIRLHKIASILEDAIAALKPADWPEGAAKIWDLLGHTWIAIVGIMNDYSLKPLDSVGDRLEVARMIDKGYQKAARSFGFTQFHSVALESALAATAEGYRLEMKQSLDFVLSLQSVPSLSEKFRISGEPTLANLTSSFNGNLEKALEELTA